MEHAHTNPASSQDHILAAFLEPGALPDIAKRVNMSLAALATWTNKNIELLEGVHKLLVTRCKLIAAQLELSALTALSTVSSAAASTDDPKLRERALERQRKAANAILRHNTRLERTPSVNSARGGPHAPPQAMTLPSNGNAPPTSPRQSGEKYPRPQAEGDVGDVGESTAIKLPLAHRLAARKLAALTAT